VISPFQHTNFPEQGVGRTIGCHLFVSTSFHYLEEIKVRFWAYDEYRLTYSSIDRTITKLHHTDLLLLNRLPILNLGEKLYQARETSDCLAIKLTTSESPYLRRNLFVNLDS